jgi:hypothetical protein
MNMKKRIGYIFVLALLTSCSSDLPIDTTEPYTQPQGADGFISFGASSGWATTRGSASDVDLEYLQTTGFGVYANTSERFIMNNQAVTYDEATGWTYTPEQRWPRGSVNFYAYAPLGDSSVTPSDAASTITYTISDINNPTDLMWGVKPDTGLPFTGITSDYNEGGIDFNFKHALARVQLNIQASSNLSYIDETTVINSNTLRNFYRTQYNGYIDNIEDVDEAKQLLADTEESVRVATGAPFLGILIFEYTNITSENIEDYWGTSFNTVLGPQSVTENIKDAMKENTHIRDYWVNQMIEEFLSNTSNTKAYRTQKLVLESIRFTNLYTSGLLDLNNTTANEPLWSNQTGSGTYNGFTIPAKAQNTANNRNNIAVNGYGISTDATSIDGTYLVIPSDQIQAQITYRTVTSTPYGISGTYNNPTITTRIDQGNRQTYTTTVPRNLTGNNTYTLNVTIQ